MSFKKLIILNLTLSLGCTLNCAEVTKKEGLAWIVTAQGLRATLVTATTTHKELASTIEKISGYGIENFHNDHLSPESTRPIIEDPQFSDCFETPSRHFLWTSPTNPLTNWCKLITATTNTGQFKTVLYEPGQTVRQLKLPATLAAAFGMPSVKITRHNEPIDLEVDLPVTEEFFNDVIFHE